MVAGGHRASPNAHEDDVVRIAAEAEDVVAYPAKHYGLTVQAQAAKQKGEESLKRH